MREKEQIMGNETEILSMLRDIQQMLGIILGVVIGGIISILLFK